MPQILCYVAEAKLVIVGDGPMRRALIRQTQKLNLTSSVIFLGSQTNVEDVTPIFDIYACSSFSEGTSMTILEAMACGLPIVASAVGGNTQLVDRSNGVLFELEDEGCFVQGVTALLKDRSEASAMGRKSRERAERNYSVDNMIRQYEMLYTLYR
jgi:glycosyltransferase involved in cell wall biosynthesis